MKQLSCIVSEYLIGQVLDVDSHEHVQGNCHDVKVKGQNINVMLPVKKRSSNIFLISNCIFPLIYCVHYPIKLSHFHTLSVFEMIPFQPLHFISACCDYCDVILLRCSTNKTMCTVTSNWLEWGRKEMISLKRTLINFIINKILSSLGYWTTIDLHYIRYKKKTTFI